MVASNTGAGQRQLAAEDLEPETEGASVHAKL